MQIQGPVHAVPECAVQAGQFLIHGLHSKSCPQCHLLAGQGMEITSLQ